MKRHKHIGDGIYEFKAKTARIYSFTDERRIVLTHGGNKPKSVVKDRDFAKDIRDSDYHEWKRKGRL